MGSIASQTPLYASLITPNPTLDSRNQKPDKGHSTTFFTKPPKIVPWEHFNLQSLHDAYGDILHSNMDSHVNELPSFPIQVNNVKHLKVVYEQHIFPSILERVAIGARSLSARLGREPPQVRTARDNAVEPGLSQSLQSALSFICVGVASPAIV
ncbi:hypothetical protein FGRMN_5169 [Fusarium graminum]|nr:hypothetical protein FGRMN_5169 [Fusarium graminum]